MSWTPKHAKEAFEGEDWVSPYRLKTKRWIRVYLSDDPKDCDMVTRVEMERGEVLHDGEGDLITVIAPTGIGTDRWTHKTYSVKVEIFYNDSQRAKKGDSKTSR